MPKPQTCRAAAAKTITKLHTVWFCVLSVSAILTSGCQSMYYSTMEKFGVEKRDILVDRVEDAQEAQQDAKRQFESALEQFIAVTNYNGGDLEQQYKKLKSEYEDSQSKAQDVSKRIADVDRVAGDLFAEWKQELSQYSNQDLKRASQKQLQTTQKSYKKLIDAMKTAEAKIQPVLDALEDRVLFLKHNLNANAIASLRHEKKTVELNIAVLIRDMNNSIEEADRFIKSMTSQ